MSQVNELVREIEQLQKQTNDAIVKKQTAIAKRESILKDIQQLKEKSLLEFGCQIDKLQEKRQQYSIEIEEKISILKKVLGV